MNDKYLADAKKCCDKAAVPPPGAESLYPTGFWEMAEMCREMEDNNQWDAPAARRRRLASKKNTPVPQNVWEGFSMHPGIPIGVVAIISSVIIIIIIGIIIIIIIVTGRCSEGI